jgi:hypothetical protein
MSALPEDVRALFDGPDHAHLDLIRIREETRCVPAFGIPDHIAWLRARHAR